MSQENTQCKKVVVPQMDEVSVSTQAGYIVITQNRIADGAEDVIWIHPVFADAICAAIMRGASEAGGK